MFKSLRDHVYDYIVERLADGSLVPDAKLNEKDLCDTLHVSRTPVKEALIQLENEGYLERLPRKGFIVKAFTDRSVFEKYQILSALDALAAELAISRLTDEDIDEMESFIDSMDKAICNGDYDNYNSFQYQFHNTYIKRCGNQQLIDLIDKLERSFIRKFEGRLDGQALTDALKKTNQEHKNICEIFQKKDSDDIGKYIRATHWNLKYIKH